MKVYRIWNETKQRWEASNKRSFWPTLSGAKSYYARLVKQEEYYRYSKRNFYPDYFIIKAFELKEIVTE